MAEVLVVHPRLLRRIVKQHVLRQGHAVGGVVPHAHCHTLRRAELLELVEEGQLPHPIDHLTENVLLLSNPGFLGNSLHERRKQMDRLQRIAFHGSVHLLLAVRTNSGLLNDATVRSRIDELGQAEFEEVRSALDHDDLLLPKVDDRQVYQEFAAVFLETHFFAPELLVTTFPGIEDVDAVLELLSKDLNLDDLGRRARRSPAWTAPEPFADRPETPKRKAPLSGRAAARNLRRATRAHNQGRLARALVSEARATGTRDEATEAQARERLEADVQTLTLRLERALGQPRDSLGASGWDDPIRNLAESAALRDGFFESPEARALRELVKAAESHETPGFIVDVSAWLFSRGKRPVVRQRNATKTLQVVRNVESARDAAAGAQLAKKERQRLDAMLHEVAQRAEERVRSSLRPRIVQAMEHVRLLPLSGPELQGRDTLVEELLDQVLARGFLSLSQLRDAVSRNELKLPDLTPTRELRRGDPLLRLDRRLALDLDGIYRRGDIYLRWLQKISSLCFGTKSGRLVTFWLLLPALGAFTIVEGTVLITGPIARWLGTQPWHFHFFPFALTAVALLGLLHSEGLRIAARLSAEALGLFLSTIFVRIPTALLGGVAVQRLLAQPGFRTFARMVVLPACLAFVTYTASPFEPERQVLRLGLTGLTFVVLALLMGSRLGFWLEEFYLEHLAPAWSTLSRQWAPALFRAINRTFFVAMDALDRATHSIGEFLRLRRSLSPLGVFVAGFAGLVWGISSYVLRLYMTLLVEPEINPVKHFPVVTVAHKLMLPFLPDLLRVVERPFSLLGPVLGGSLAGLTVFLLPSIFGFLAWEFKANARLYRRTRSRFIPPLPFGPHGETCRELLVTGLHSGTIPKLYDRLRRAARRQAEKVPYPSASGKDPGNGRRSETGRFTQGLQHVERSLRRLIERQFFPPLLAAGRWSVRDIGLGKVAISSNRLKCKLVSSTYGPTQALEITIEQLGGYLVASLSQTGFLARLTREEQDIFENCLAIFYHRLGVDVVREQLEAELGDQQFEVTEEGLVVRHEGRSVVVTYRLDAHFRKRLKARAVGMKRTDIPTLLATRVLYRRQRIAFVDWEHAFRCASAAGPVPRLLTGPGLLGPLTIDDASF